MTARTARRKGGSRGGVVVFLVTAMVMGALFVPTAILLVAGMMPTLAALLIDRDEKKSTTVAVGLLNAAGVAPFVVRLWSQGQTLEQSFAIVSQVNTWLFMYGAAAIGWLVLYSVPGVIHVVLVQRAKLRIADIETRQQTLRELWGEEVRTSK